MTDRTLQQALADACLKEDAREALLADPAAFLRARGVPEDEIAAMGDGARRLVVYRALVQNNLKDVTYNLLEKTRSKLGPRFDRDFAGFLSERGPRTPYLRDVPAEFLDWVLPRWRADTSLPPWTIDSARHELAVFYAGAAPEVAEPALGDIALDRPVAFASAVRLLDLDHAVHEAAEAPAARPVHLLVHRDAEYLVRVLELTPLASALVRRLLAGEALAPAIGAACADVAELQNDETLASIARLLADFGERGIVLGARR